MKVNLPEMENISVSCGFVMCRFQCIRKSNKECGGYRVSIFLYLFLLPWQCERFGFALLFSSFSSLFKLFRFTVLFYFRIVLWTTLTILENISTSPDWWRSNDCRNNSEHAAHNKWHATRAATHKEHSKVGAGSKDSVMAVYLSQSLWLRPKVAVSG